MLFEIINRTNTEPATHSDTEYNYLNESARLYAKCIRTVLEDWFTRYPDEEKNEFMGRFKSPNDYTHIAATFELYLHEIMLKLGFSVTVHPPTNTHSDKTPDFLVSDGANKFYLEAVSVSEASEDERSADKRKNTLYDVINSIEQTNFFVTISYSGMPNTPLPARNIKRDIEQWLNTLNPDKIMNEMDEDNASFPKLTFEHDGWKLSFRAHPRSLESRGDSSRRTIGGMIGEAKWSQADDKIKKAIKKKGNKYGELEYPFIIACNVRGFYLANIDILDALFGQEEVVITPNNLNRQINSIRKKDGLWYGNDGAQYKRISGIIFGHDIKSSTFKVKNIKLYKNPWAINECSGDIHKLPHTFLFNKKFVVNQGAHPSDILELPDCFPGEPQNHLKSK